MAFSIFTLYETSILSSFLARAYSIRLCFSMKLSISLFLAANSRETWSFMLSLTSYIIVGEASEGKPPFRELLRRDAFGALVKDWPDWRLETLNFFGGFLAVASYC